MSMSGEQSFLAAFEAQEALKRRGQQLEAYKRALKKGARAGITGDFGSARDLLPQLTGSQDVLTRDSVLLPEADPQLFCRVVNELISQYQASVKPEGE